VPVRGATEAERQFVERFESSRSLLVKWARSVPAIVQTARELAQTLNPRELFEIEWPPGVLDSLKSGVLEWKPSADGTFPVVVKQHEGKQIAKHLKLRKSAQMGDVLRGVNNLAIQSALADIVGRLEEMGEKLDELLARARADQVGKIRAGHDLYQQALTIRDEDLRRSTLLNAVQSLLEGRNQLLEFVEDASTKLKPPSQFDSFLKAVPFGRTPSKALEERYHRVTQEFQTAVLATRIVVLAYEELNEPETARFVLEQLAGRAKDIAPRCLAAARHLPYTPEEPPEAPWEFVEQRLIPAFEEGLLYLGSERAKAPVRVLVSGEELLGHG
jgi:hypothetical protein